MTHKKLLRIVFMASLAWGLLHAPPAARAVPQATHTNPVSLPGVQFSINSSLAQWDVNTQYQAADDFRVPQGGTWWLVNQVSADGHYSIANAPAVQVAVEFYYDSGTNLPGGLHSRQVIPASGLTDLAGKLTIPLATLAFAPGQRYWVSVQPLMPNVQSSVWFWQVGTGTMPGINGNGYPSVHYNSTTQATCPKWTSRGGGGGQACGDPPEWGTGYTELGFALAYNEFTPTEFIYLPVVRR